MMCTPGRGRRRMFLFQKKIDHTRRGNARVCVCEGVGGPSRRGGGGGGRVASRVVFTHVRTHNTCTTRERANMCALTSTPYSWVVVAIVNVSMAVLLVASLLFE